MPDGTFNILTLIKHNLVIMQSHFFGVIVHCPITATPLLLLQKIH